jgi:hypothetical protein
MRKNSFTLIEVTISFALFFMMASTLFFWYGTISKRKEKFNRLERPLMEEQQAYLRLKKILQTAEIPFFHSENSLVFIFDMGPYEDPKLSGKVLARLFHDPSSECIFLGIWPAPQEKEILRSPSRTFMLLDKVKTCSFEFFHPPDLFQKPVDPNQVGKKRPKEGWQNLWDGEFETLPAMLKIWIRRHKVLDFSTEKFAFCFDFPIPILLPQESV